LARGASLSATLSAFALALAAAFAATVSQASVAIQGHAMTGCVSDPDEPGVVQPCTSQPVAGIVVRLEQNGAEVASSLTSTEGAFVLDAPGPGTYAVVGSGNCGEQPEVQVTVVAGQPLGPVTLSYPNDPDDSANGSCASAPSPTHPGPVSGTPGTPNGPPASRPHPPTKRGSGHHKRRTHRRKHKHRHHKPTGKHRHR
jgi:hypothetical protein